jgi:hypothetical protein
MAKVHDANTMASVQEAKEKQKNMTQVVIESMSLYTPSEAAAFYKARCVETEVKPNNTFLRMLTDGEELSVVNFSNNYFGDRGMKAVAPVLGKVPVIALDLRNTGFSAADAGFLGDAMQRHPTLTSIDLRENSLSVPTARRLLTLLMQNKRITTLQLDDDAPKAALIHKQCIENSDVCMYASCCLVCLRSMMYDDAHYAESHLLMRLYERLGPMLARIAPVEMEVLCRSVLACLELNDGVLFLCGHECIESLVDDLITACQFVTKLPGDKRAKHPKHQAISRCAQQVVATIHTPLASAQPTTEVSRRESTFGGSPPHHGKTSKEQGSPSPTAHLLAKAAREEAARLGIQKPPELEQDRVGSETWQGCSVCGTACMVLTENTSALMMKMVNKDVALLMQKRSQLRPSAFTRVVRRILADVAPRVCSVKCLRAHVRFGIFGYGGVIRPRPSAEESHIAEVCRCHLPPDDVDFGVIDFTKAHHYDHSEEDTTCALAVASTVSDVEGVRIDPYFTYAAAKHLSRSRPQHFGLDLRRAMESACVYGCLPAEDAPYDPLTPPNTWNDWTTCWTQRQDFMELRKKALSRRKAQFFAVHSPGGNLFDEMRSALWTTRGLRRPLLGALKWRSEWFACRNGVIPTEKFSGGFYVAVKVLGQCRLADGVVRLILHPMFGQHVGRNGFFFASRTVVNRGFKFGAYIFLEPESNGLSSPSASLTTRVGDDVKGAVARVMRDKTAAYALLRLLAEPRACRREGLERLQQLLTSMPASVSFALFLADGPTVAPEHDRQLRYLRALFAADAELQLTFLFAQALPGAVTAWFASKLADVRQATTALAAGSDVTVATAARSPRSTAAGSQSRVWEEEGLDDASVFAASPTLNPQPPAKSKSAAAQSPRKPAASSRSKKNQQPVVQLVNDAARESHEQLLREVAATLERDRSRVRELTELGRRRTASSWAPPSHLLESANPAMVAAAGRRADELATLLHLSGERWHVVNVLHTATPTLLIFMGDHVARCYLDSEYSEVRTGPFVKMADTPEFAEFPFRSGFDACAICEHVSPTGLYVFAQEHWLLWDLGRNSCIAGPFHLRLHPKFQQLPDAFTRRGNLKAVFAESGKPHIIFCHESGYAVLDVTTQQLVGEHEFSAGHGGLLNLPAGASPVAQLPLWLAEESIPAELLEGATSVFVSSTGAIMTDNGQELGNVSTVWPAAPIELRLGEVGGAIALLRGFAARVTTQALLASVALFVPPALQETTPQGVADAVLPGAVGANRAVRVSVRGFETIGAPGDVLTALSSTDAHKSLKDLTVFQKSGVAARCVVEFDFGDTSHCRFGYVQLITSAPSTASLTHGLRVAVECSWDGIAYRTVHTACSTTSIFDMAWGATHGSRFWRLVFHETPNDFAIVRTLWHVSSWSVESRSFEAFAVYSPIYPHAVAADAAKVLCPPAALLRTINAASVVQINPSPSVYVPPHCIIPLLPPARSSLFLVGRTFTEWDWEAKALAAKESCSFGCHPGFRDLPFPFDHGIDAAFYPDPIHSRNVVLISNGLAIEWRLDDGDAATPSIPIGQSPWLAGVPAPFDRVVDAAVNLWDRPGQVVLFSGDLVMTWYVAELQIVDPPAPRHTRAYLHAPSMKGRAVTTATTIPSDAGKVLLFLGERFAIIDSTRDRHVTTMRDDLQVLGSRELPGLSWTLDWGVPRTETAVTFDFGEDNPVLMGITLHMALASGTSAFEESTWTVHAGDDGRTWRLVCAAHRQTSLTSTSHWPIPAAGARYYRLSLVSSRAKHEQHMLQARFHTPRSTRVTLTPMNRRTTGRLLRGGAAPTTNIQFLGPLSKSQPGIAIFDFGETSAIEAVSVTIQQLPPSQRNPREATLVVPHGAEGCQRIPAPACWHVMYSDDGESWKSVGVWRVRGAATRLCWAACLPHRFWRVDLEACNIANPTPVFSGFVFEEHSGVAVCPPLGHEYTQAQALLCPLPWRAGNIHAQLPGEVGRQLVFDCKGQPQAFVGVTVSADVSSSAFTTRLVIEYSEDGATWFGVGDVVVSRESATAVWESEGAFRFWRLLVTRHYGSQFVTITSVDWSDSGPALYMRHRRHLAQVDHATFRAKNRMQSEFVSVRAKLPPQSRWLVEMGAPLAMEWSTVAAVVNSSTSSEFVTASWPAQGSSVYWRLRCVDNDGNSTNEAAASEVQWYSFCGATSHPFHDMPDGAEVTLKGLTYAPLCTAASLFEDRKEASAALLMDTAGWGEEQPVNVLEDDNATATTAAVEFTFAEAARFSSVEIALGHNDGSPRKGSTFEVGDITATVELVDADASAVTKPLCTMLLCDDVEVLSWSRAEAAFGRTWRVRLTCRGKNLVGIRHIRWNFDHGAVAPVLDRWLPAVSNELLSESLRARDIERGLAIETNFREALPVAQTHFSSSLPPEELPPLDTRSNLVLSCLKAQKQAQSA